MRILQLLDALDYGDGVSNDVINKHKLLKEMGYSTEIYSKWVNDNVKDYRKDIKILRVNKDDIILHHFSGKSHIIEDIIGLKCKKIFVYHNITPAEFWTDNKDTMQSFKQIEKYLKYYNYVIADSEFNLKDLMGFGLEKGDVLPVYIDFEKIGRIQKEYRRTTQKTTFLFVGRVAPNKKHEDIINVFDYYYKYIDSNSQLYFVGNFQNYMDYYNKLKEHLNKISCKKQVHFTGKVDNKELYQYYVEADVFLCMSEHEGFCIPLLESMYSRVPTLAYACCAVKETMGDAGVLIHKKTPEALAKLIYIILNDKSLRNSILIKQKNRVESFSKDKLKINFDNLIKKWSME